MQSYIDRIVRAAKLDVNLYEEVEADKGALGQAMGVVVLSSIAAGLGIIGQVGIKGIFIGAITALIAWYVWGDLHRGYYSSYCLVCLGLYYLFYRRQNPSRAANQSRPW